MAKTATAREKSPMNKHMYEATGANAIGDAPAPGSSAFIDVEIEGLGKLSDFPTAEELKNSDEGTGERCVVLCDYLSGSGPDDFHNKGQVVRLSKLVAGLDDPTVSRDVVKGRVKRLFDLRAIRLATRQEIKAGFVEVTFESESHSTQTERQKRIELEQENETLRAALSRATLAQEAADPTKAGVSQGAQDAADNPNADLGDKKGKGSKVKEEDDLTTWE